jgi:radical SAM protein (TIGR01212 family)
MQSKPKPYRDFASYLRSKFGRRVQKIPVDAGFTCPNRDGTVGVGGCLYCSADGTASPVIMRELSIEEQVKRGIDRVRRKYSNPLFMVYFQPHTNTYAPVEVLSECYFKSLAVDKGIVGLAIGTRPDCLGEEVLGFLTEFLDREIWIEIGLQSMHDKTLALINRGHDLATFEDAVLRTAEMDFKICVHVILGLPGESYNQMLQTADYLNMLPIDGLKIHSLYVVEGTGLADMFRKGKLNFLTMEEYISLTCDFLEHLRSDIIIQRLTGDPPPQGLLGPHWCKDKRKVLNGILAEFASRGTCQGSWYEKSKQTTIFTTS